MCLKPRALPPIPEDTREVALQIYRRHPVAIRLGDDFADVLRDEDFQDLYSHTGQPALSPAFLALVMILQFLETASDRIAVEMVRSRIDWKYALHLPLCHPGFDSSVLCEFRQRLANNDAERRAFDAFLERLKEKGFLQGRRLQRTDSIAVLGAIRELNRLELVMEALRLALEAIISEEPLWFAKKVPEQWLDTYGEWTQAERLIKETGPKAATQLRTLLLRTGQDGFKLLDWLQQDTTPAALRELETVKLLQKVWQQQYRRLEQTVKPIDLKVEEQLCEDAAAVRQAAQKAQSGIPEAEDTDSIDNMMTEEVQESTPKSRKQDGISDVIVTPHDPEARLAVKRGKAHTGFKLHLTQTATSDAPKLITDVAIAAAASHDGAAMDDIQERLHQRDLLAQEHLADSGYVCGSTLHSSQQRGVRLLGPVSPDTSTPERKAAGCALDDFTIDFAQQRACCPQGQWSVGWHTKRRWDQPQLQQVTIRWDKPSCGACPLRSICLSPKQDHRVLSVSQHHEMILARRREQKTEAFKEQYRHRAGIEATFSNMVNVHGGRRTAYKGASKTLLYYLHLSIGMNIKQVHAWEAGIKPKLHRRNNLRRLAAAAATH